MKDLEKGICTRRRYYNKTNTNIEYDNELGNSLIRDLVTPHSKRKRSNYDNTDDTKTVSNVDNKSGYTLVKDLGKGFCTKRGYYHNKNTNLDYDNESGNTSIRDLVKTHSKRKRSNNDINVNCDNESGNTLIKDFVKHSHKRKMYNYSDYFTTPMMLTFQPKG